MKKQNARQGIIKGKVIKYFKEQQYIYLNFRKQEKYIIIELQWIY